jgi:cyclophilin family peptidyl-prolyl cis-trans isomerase
VPSQAKRQRKKEGQRARQEAVRLAEARAARRRRIVLAVVAVAAVVGIAYLVSRGSSKKTSVATKTSTTTALSAATAANSTTKCPAADGSSPKTTHFTTGPPACISLKKTYTATFDTTEGKIVVALDNKKTPKTANNFVVLARYHFYDGTPIFRTDTNLEIIQGGGTGPSDPGPGYTIPDEGLKFTYAPGDLTMANTGQPNSGGAEWFFVAGAKASTLDSQGSYVTFAKVTSGLDVVKAILALNKDTPGSQLGGAPSRTVTIKTVTITES